MHPGLSAVADYLAKNDLSTLAPGSHVIDGKALYVNVMEVKAQAKSRALLEYHRKYIDVQLVLQGVEQMGWTARRDLPADTHFDQDMDFALLQAPVSNWFTVHPGFFALFMPDDAHAPCCGTGKIRKAVFKVRI